MAGCRVLPLPLSVLEKPVSSAMSVVEIAKAAQRLSGALELTTSMPQVLNISANLSSDVLSERLTRQRYRRHRAANSRTSSVDDMIGSSAACQRIYKGAVPEAEVFKGYEDRAI